MMKLFLQIISMAILFISTSAISNDNNTIRKELQMKMLSKVKGNGSPIILVPGGLTGWISWDPHADILSAKRKVCQVQLINVEYGLDKRPLPEDYSVQTESRALEATIEDFGLTEPVDIVAWSYGAAVTLDYALDHQEKIRSLTLIEPPAFWVLRTNGSFDNETKAITEKMMNYHGDISDDMLADFMGTVGFLAPGQKAQTLPQWKLWVQYKLSLRNNPAVIANNNDIKKVTRFSKPVLLVKGTGSAKFLHNIIDSLGHYFPDNKIVELPAGHAPQIVSMNQFLEILEKFQNEVK